MKLSLILILGFALNVSAEGYSQNKVSLRLKKTTISDVLSAIEVQTNYRFLYNDELGGVRQKVSINVHEAEVKEVLDKVLGNTSLVYQFMENNLVVIRENPEVPAVVFIPIRGQVMDETGKGLAGVSVSVKGTQRGTTTDANGNFTIEADQGATLVFSYVGFVTQEMVVGTETTVNVALVARQGSMDEVVVIGYGTAQKRDLTGSIVKISGKEVENKPNTNPVASLQGKVAGLSVVNSGTPGQEPDIRIRGTISTDPQAAKPLYIVDGIFNDNINYLNPNDIESIEILKDPSSLAIFGVRGAAGVIAITTKKARAGQITINLNSTFGAKKLVDKIEMVDAEGFRTLYTEQQISDNVPANQMFDFTPWTGNTDWVDQLTQTGMFNANNLSVSASSDKNKFYMGVGYTSEEGIVKHEKLEKISLTMNDEFKISKAIKIGISASGIRQRLPYSAAQGLLYDARRILPITPVYSSANGAYYDLAIQSAQITNPVMVLENNWNKELRYENRLVGNVFVEFNFLRDFNFRGTWYADMSNLDNRTYRPIDSVYNPAVNQTFIHPSYNRTSVFHGTERWNKFQQDYVLNYKKGFGVHNVAATGAFTTYYNEYRGNFATVRQSLTGLPIPNDERFWYIDNGFGDPSTRESSSGQTESALVSGLFRIMYNYDRKYFFTGSYRSDYSSAFRTLENQQQAFYAVGLGWDITREDFMSDQEIFNLLKLKASWGILGVQNTHGYAYPAYPTVSQGATAVFGNLVVPSYSPDYTPDPNLKWESVDGKEVGLEVATFQNRLIGEIAYYHRTTKDLLAIINIGGGNFSLRNLDAEIVNKGFELAATWSDKLRNDLSYSISGNFTTYDNKVTRLPAGGKLNASEERPNQTEQGFPIGYFYGYVVEGVYQSYAEKLASPVMALGNAYGPGDLKYKDINGDGVINTDDRTMIGNPTPDFTYGGNITLNYKGFDFGVDMQGVFGNEIYRFWGSSELPFTQFNYPAFKMNRWTGEGTSNWDPVINTSHTTNRLASTYGIEDGSYFRIRNIQIGYNFNQAALRKIYVKNLRIFANVQNLKTFKNNSGYSPEFGGSPTHFGIDDGTGPVPVVFTGGINVTF